METTTNWGGILGGGLAGFLVGNATAGGGLLGGGNNGQRCATVEDVAAGFNFAGVNGSLKDLMIGQANTNQNIGNAICQLGYQNSQETYSLASKIDSCCCATQLGMKDIIATIIAEGSATRNMMRDQENQNLRDTNMRMYIDNALCGVPKSFPYSLMPPRCQ